MSKFYKPQRTKNIYNPQSTQPFKLSRSKIDLFIECPRCFYLDRRLGVARPPGFPFSINSAVDKLLKQEFDIHRANGTTHPLIKRYGVSARRYVDGTELMGVENFCLCRLDPFYVSRPSWSQSSSVIYHKKGKKRFHVYPILFVEYKFFFGGKEYSLNGAKANGRS